MAPTVRIRLELEPEDQTRRGHGGVSGNMRVQRGELEVGPVVNVSAILGAKRDVFHQREVCSASVYKCSPRLLESSGNGLARIVGRIKDERASPGQSIRVDPGTAREGHNECSSSLVHIGLNAKRTTSGEVLLRVAGVAIICFGGKPAIEVITVPDEEAARVG